MKYLSTLLLPVFCLLFSAVHAQKKIMQLKADSVRIFSNCDTAELMLENRTRSVVNGVLTNKGEGVTEFRKVLQKLGDTACIIGGDTLNAAAFSKNIYNSSGQVTNDRVVDGNKKNIQFKNNSSYLIANNARPVIISRSPMDSALLGIVNNSSTTPFTGLVVRGTGCDANITLVSDSAGTCNEEQMIDFATLKPRSDAWLTRLPGTYGDRNLLGRIVLQTSKTIPDYATLSFGIKSDTVFFHDGAYNVLCNPGFSGGYTPFPVMSINPSFKHPTQNFNTKMPFVKINGGLFVGFSRDWYFNSRNANDIINGVDDVAGYVQPFYETRFSVYADSLPIKIYKLPAIKGTAFLSYSPTKTVEGNNVAFEYRDSVFEDIRNYISMAGLTTPSDLHLKEHITASRFNTAKLLRLSIRDFNYKSDKNKTRYTGLIAQELKILIPELVIGKEGNYSIDYIKMVPYLLKLLQDQQAEIERLNRQQSVTVNATGTTIPAAIAQLQQQLLSQQEAIRVLQKDRRK